IGDQIPDVLLVNFGIVVHIHRSELEECELAAVAACALLPEEDRTIGGQLDENGNNQKKRRQYDQSGQSSRHINRSLDKGGTPCFRTGLMFVRIENLIGELIIRKNMYRDLDVLDLAGIKMDLKHALRSLDDDIFDGVSSCFIQRRQNDADGATVLIPSGNVG